MTGKAVAYRNGDPRVKKKVKKGVTHYVYASKSAAAKKGKTGKWNKCFMKARQKLKIKGFVVMRKTGGTKLERDLYKETKKCYKK